MTTHGEGPTPDEDEDDQTIDFTAITGVGSKTSSALNDAGISSMERLAAMTVGQVVSALEGVGVQISAGKIVSQLWLQQAWMLSELSDEPEDRGAEGDELDTGLDPASDSGETSDAEDWSEQFGLFVYIDRSVDGLRWRTRIWDTTALVEENLSGIAPGLVVDLIIDRISTQVGS